MAVALPFVFLNTSLLNTLIYYLAGDATDAIDGFLARKWKVQSRYGKIVDPIADKMLNGLTLILTSIFVNPLMFILTGFEALIATTALGHFHKNKDISVSQIGRIKTAFLFFTIILALIAPMVPSLNIVSNVLIGLTATLQAITASKYLYDFHKENKMQHAHVSESIIQPIADTKTDEIKQLNHVKERLHILASKQKITSTSPIRNDMIVDEPISNDEDTIKKEDLGISRTLKK
jgi:phosphatidylglycerophosphate synthase